MKKLIFTAQLLSITGLMFAQSPQRQINHEPAPAMRVDLKPDFDPFKAPESSISKFGKGGIVSDWYVGEDLARATSVGGGINAQGSIAFMYHDSITKSKYSSQTDFSSTGNWISAGHILDVHDDVIDLTTPLKTKLSKYTSYTLDSIRFSYVYVRPNDSMPDGNGGNKQVIDTLFVYYFKTNKINKIRLVNASQQTVGIAGMVDWNGGSVRKATNYFSVDTLLLTSSDSTSVFNTNGSFENSFGVKIAALKAPAGMSVNKSIDTSDNLVGFTLLYKSGFPTISPTTGDTAVILYQFDPSTLPPGTRRANYFGFTEFRNSGTQQLSNLKFYNTPLFAPSWASYVPSSGGWDGYLPGFGFTSDLFFDGDFKITSGPTGVNEVSKTNAISNVYPNPAQVNGAALINFNLDNASNVNMTMFNLVGQQVKTIVSKNFTSGVHTQEIDLSGVKPGVYFISLTADGVTSTKKLTVTE